MFAETVDGAYINKAHIVELLAPSKQEFIEHEDVGGRVLSLNFFVGGRERCSYQEDSSKSYLMAVMSNGHTHVLTTEEAASVIS